MDYQRLYEFRFRDVDQGARDAVWREIAPWVHELAGRPARVLDPAAGRGEFINHVPAQERWAVDAVEHVEGTYAAGVRAITSPILAVDLPAGHFDLVWVSNFIEHLSSQDDVHVFLKRMHEAIAPSGCIVIMGPNFAHTYREYFDFADHRVLLTHKGVAEHLYTAGFTPEQVVSKFLPFSFTGSLPAGAKLARAYLRFRPAWQVLGKQYLLVGRKPQGQSAPSSPI